LLDVLKPNSMRKFYLTLIGLLALGSSIFSQDVHFSQYYSYSPNLNPALTGNFDGSYRVGAIYRNQWSSNLKQHSFVTPGAFVDVPLFEGALRGDKVGVGVFAMNDMSGSAGLSNLTAGLSLAYHLAFGKSNQHTLSAGLQGAFVQKRIDPRKTTFFDQFDEISWTGYNATTENLSRTSFMYGDFSAGLYWRSHFSKLFSIQAGFSGYHLQSFFGGTDEAFLITGNNLSPLYARLNADLGLEFTIKDKWIIAPEALYSLQGPSKKLNQMQDIVVGSSFGYKFNTGFRNKTNLMLGVRYRLKDAVIPMVSVEFRNCRLGAAYDVTTSDLHLSNRHQGAFEICLIYTGESIRSFKANKTLPARRF